MNRGSSRLRAGVTGGVVMLAMLACGGCQGEADEPPAFTRQPVFTRAGDSGVDTSLRFADVTRASGIDFVHATGAFGEKWMPETMGSGVAWLDYDTDGWPDLLFVNGTGWPGHASGRGATMALYRNIEGRRFDDVTAEVGLDHPLYGMGVSAADYDADGDPDVYITAVGANRLFENRGGRFVDVTSRTGTTGDPPEGAAEGAWSTGAAWVDVDRDGWLDLFVCNYVQWTAATDLYTTLDGEHKSYATPEQYDGESCRLYRADGRGGFSDVTSEAGVDNPRGKSLGVAVHDLNGDGWLDLIVANDTYQNFLYLNDGDGTFTDRASSSGVALDEFGRARAGMGIDVADVRGRGRLSIAIGNFSNEPISLYTQIGDSLYQDLAGSARITRATLLPLTFGLTFADLDLDMDPDLVLANGHIEPEIQAVQQDVTFEQKPQLLLNNGQGQFVDVSEQVGEGFDTSIVGRGIAVSDYDRDGDLDVAISVNGGAPRLLRNDLPSAGVTWIRVRLDGDPPNLDAIGARVRVYASAGVTEQTVRTAASYLSQHETGSLLFGLDGAPNADSVRVDWPRGRTSVIGPVHANTSVEIREREANKS